MKQVSIKSTDPRKKPLMALFKKYFNCDKVTDVCANEVTASARCFKHVGHRKYQNMGIREIHDLHLIKQETEGKSLFRYPKTLKELDRKF